MRSPKGPSDGAMFGATLGVLVGDVLSAELPIDVEGRLLELGRDVEATEDGETAGAEFAFGPVEGIGPMTFSLSFKVELTAGVDDKYAFVAGTVAGGNDDIGAATGGVNGCWALGGATATAAIGSPGTSGFRLRPMLTKTTARRAASTVPPTPQPIAIHRPAELPEFAECPYEGCGEPCSGLLDCKPPCGNPCGL
jgi:hypothetical protein